MLCIRASIGTCSKVSDVSRDAGVFSAHEVRDEVWQADHLVRHSKAKLLELVMNIAKDCITGAASYQHDCEYRDAH
jgi:hypothetical protein